MQGHSGMEVLKTQTNSWSLQPLKSVHYLPNATGLRKFLCWPQFTHFPYQAARNAMHWQAGWEGTELECPPPRNCACPAHSQRPGCGTSVVEQTALTQHRNPRVMSSWEGWGCLCSKAFQAPLKFYSSDYTVMISYPWKAKFPIMSWFHHIHFSQIPNSYYVPNNHGPFLVCVIIKLLL